MTIYKHVVWDDLREFVKGGLVQTPPEEDVLYLRTEEEGMAFIQALGASDVIENLYLDHDLGLHIAPKNAAGIHVPQSIDATTRAGVLWLADKAHTDPENMPEILHVFVISANPPGAGYIGGLARHFCNDVKVMNAEFKGLFVSQDWAYD